MYNKSMKMNLSHNLNKLAEIFGKDTPLFAVGGCVRNALMRLDYHDIDICACLKVNEVEKLLTGTDFEVRVKNQKLNTCEIICGDNRYEYATFRKEFYLAGGAHSPNKTSFDATIVEDVSRRDYTCNSLYYEIINKKLIDFFGGERDIKNKVIKTVLEPEAVLVNDGVRIMRLVRFAAEFNFEIDETTFEAAKKYRDNLNNISKEHIKQEFLKIINANATYKKIDRKSLFNKNRAYNGIKLLDKLDLWKYFGKDERLALLRGVGAYLKCFMKTKENYLEAFLVDAYFYLKNSKVQKSPADFVTMIMGGEALCFSKADKKSIQELLKALDYIDELEKIEPKKRADYIFKLPVDKKVSMYVKMRGGRKYSLYKRTLKILKDN